MNAENMKESARKMQTMTSADLDSMMQEMSSMPAAQMEELKKMGMDPALMKKSMEMMKENPGMMNAVGKMMENMTPEEMLAQSRAAQEQMKNLSVEQLDQLKEARSMATDAQILADGDDDNSDETAAVVAMGSTDPSVIDANFRLAEIMSQPPSGGVTRASFGALPVITALSGSRDEDLSQQELQECWTEGGNGNDRVDRAGFERVWKEVQDYFDGDIIDEARKTLQKKVKKVRPAEAVAAAPAAAPATPIVGAALSPDELAKQVKSMKDEDLTTMLDSMSNMSAAEEARMRAMGVDPAMMKKTGEMMSKNPLLRKAAMMMMKNTSPEQMKRASEQAQKQMANMSPEDLERAMSDFENQQGGK